MHVERFVDYAEAKLQLMQFLSLSEKEKIELLADGVKDQQLRKLVLNTWVDTVPDFINHVRRITEDSVVQKFTSIQIKPKAFPAVKSREDAGVKNCFTCKKPGHIAAECRQAKSTCWKCGEVGHLSPECPKRKSTVNSALNLLCEESTEQEAAATEEAEAVYKICEAKGLDRSCVVIRRSDDADLYAYALIDTGSPVNLIKKSVAIEFCRNPHWLACRGNRQLRRVNSSPIIQLGKVHEQITLDKVKGAWFDVAFIVVEDGTMEYGVLLGRQFFAETKLKLIYQEGRYDFEDTQNQVKNLEAVLPLYAVFETDKYDIVEQNLDDSLSLPERRNLLSLLQESDTWQIKPITDNHAIRVKLKDETLFRYAPRRMSASEKQTLEQITSDLLSRGIIQYSTSPYCSRVVLVEKKNGAKRMCVDLRPLNSRVHQQKFPFPIIEDLLDQLYDKSVFTKLDLRDGFYQIHIHPEDTKYFAFATPTAQFEFVRMPFGYSEAPAEFQKRLLYIFKDLIRENKILLYIDDILIPTHTIRKNLEILQEVLHLLR